MPVLDDFPVTLGDGGGGVALGVGVDALGVFSFGDEVTGGVDLVGSDLAHVPVLLTIEPIMPVDAGAVLVIVILHILAWPDPVGVPWSTNVKRLSWDPVSVLFATVVENVHMILNVFLEVVEVVLVVEDEMPVAVLISPEAIRLIGVLPLPRFRPLVEVGIGGRHVHSMLSTIGILVDGDVISIEVIVHLASSDIVVWWSRWSIHPVLGEDVPALGSKDVLVIKDNFGDGRTIELGTPNDVVLVEFVDHVSISKLRVVVLTVHVPVPSVLVVGPGTINVFHVQPVGSGDAHLRVDLDGHDGAEAK